jgi:hypothetical protein
MSNSDEFVQAITANPDDTHLRLEKKRGRGWAAALFRLRTRQRHRKALPPK